MRLSDRFHLLLKLFTKKVYIILNDDTFFYDYIEKKVSEHALDSIMDSPVFIKESNIEDFKGIRKNRINYITYSKRKKQKISKIFSFLPRVYYIDEKCLLKRKEVFYSSAEFFEKENEAKSLFITTGLISITTAEWGFQK